MADTTVELDHTPATPSPEAHAAGDPQEKGVAALREDAMMTHLLDALDAGKDIGHYGRLVFTMVARRLLPEDEVVAWLAKDGDFSAEQAATLYAQVAQHDYNPPRRERILEWQAEQSFPILPSPDDPDCGNVYKTLRFSKHMYDGIEHYQEAKQHAGQG